MVIPKLSYQGWHDWFSSLPRTALPSSRQVIVIAPHPDDESLAVGGIIHALRSSGIPTTIIAVTDGENAYEGVRGLGPIRQEEQESALALLGVLPEQIIRLRLPDSGLSAIEEELTSQLDKCITPGCHLIAPWEGDYHPDHQACGRAAKQIAQKRNLPLSSYFFWTWHRGTPKDISNLRPVAVPLSAESLLQKRKAVQEYRSQLAFEGQSPILPTDLLWPAELKFEVLLPA